MGTVIVQQNRLENSPLNGYYQVKDVQVGFNTFIDCRQPFELGSGKNNFNIMPPVGVLIANNLIKNRANAKMVLLQEVAS